MLNVLRVVCTIISVIAKGCSAWICKWVRPTRNDTFLIILDMLCSGSKLIRMLDITPSASQ